MDLFLKEALIVVALVSGVPLLAAAVCGIMVSIFQAVTQINEQSVSFLVRTAALSAALIAGFGFFSSRIMGFTTEALASIAMLGRMP